MNIEITLAEGARAPAKATPGAAGYDLCALAHRVLLPGQRALIPTGVSLAIPHGYEAQIRPRSGLALKRGVTIHNSPGTIDSDYRGEIGVILINHGSEAFEVWPGDRIAQLVLAKVEAADFVTVDALPDTQRGQGGFGSTGVKS